MGHGELAWGYQQPSFLTLDQLRAQICFQFFPVAESLHDKRIYWEIPQIKTALLYDGNEIPFRFFSYQKYHRVL